MTEHYYSKKTEVKSDQRSFSFNLRGNDFTFTTDYGVFSKAEVDFGSRVLIEAFTMPGTPGDVLDIGCGYGPIGLSVAKEFSDRQIVMADVNERALGLAERNAIQNKIDNVTIKESDRFTNLENYSFAVILTNPPIRAGKDVVHSILEDSFMALLPGGELWVVIQKKQGAPSAIDKLEELFGNVEVVIKKKGYYVLKAEKV
ncbi:class I SAM-dependent methyltransferase [Halobacillus seohaensis]|uniref:Class I SAM-dependent methyltransferase n=1 Tax=Halobacillus seohaensis TaxID=447421 RepID=A0ABW2EI35_9BACI